MTIFVFLVAVLAVVRVTRLLTEDRLTNGYRRWVVNKWGDESWQSYWAHCSWCTSFWVGAVVMPPAILFPNQWVLLALSPFAASLAAGLLLRRG